MTHLREVLIDRFETLFVLETEDEDDRIDPMSQLKKENVRRRQEEQRETGYLSIGRIGFVSHQEKITLILDVDLFFESTSFGRVFLHVSPGEKAMDQCRFAAGQCSEQTKTDV